MLPRKARYLGAHTAGGSSWGLRRSGELSRSPGLWSRSGAWGVCCQGQQGAL